MSELQFNVVGASGPLTFFSRTKRSDLAHAYLFSGPQGVGKKTFARRLAQSLLCAANVNSTLGYDGTCSSCKLFEAGENTRHPDFIEHVGALKIGDRDTAAGFYGDAELSARDIVRQLSLESYSGGMRVLLLGDVDFATHHAANALLKFLEEPPAGVLLILTTAAPGRLIETIRSRLVEVRFPALSRDEVRGILARCGYDEQQAELGASLAEGSATRAMAALGGEEESLRTQAAAWFFEVVAGRSPEGTWATRETLNDGLEIIKTLARDWTVASAAPGARLLSADYAAALRALPPLPSANAVAILHQIEEAQRLARTNVNPAMVGELVRMTLTRC